MYRQTRFYSTVGALAYTMLILFLGAALGAAYEHSRTYTQPVVLNLTEEVHNHYLVDVDAPVNVDVAGSYNSASATVNVPDQIEILPIDPMDRLDVDPLAGLYDDPCRWQLEDAHMPPSLNPWGLPELTLVRPEILENQITDPAQVHPGLCINLLHQTSEPWGPYMVLSDPYIVDLGDGDTDLFVDLLWPSGLVLEHSLADAGIVPYTGGKWNPTNRTIKVECPPPPPPVPAMSPLFKQAIAN